MASSKTPKNALPDNPRLQAGNTAAQSLENGPTENITFLALAGIALTITFVYAYLPILGTLIATWSEQPDYQYGFLVVPVALIVLWMRKEEFPHGKIYFSWAGLSLIAASFALRFFDIAVFFDYANGLSIVLWVAGVCWLFGGWYFFRWCAPAVAFLVFMIPLPFSVEQGMRLPLQKVATNISCWTLQFLGQPALAEGNSILLGEDKLEVAEACSGLRIFMMIIVLAVVYILMIRPKWWESLILLMSILPIALISNAARIVVTGILYQYISEDAGRKFTHDYAGFMMIPLAGLLFWFVLWYLGKVMKEVPVVSMREAFRQRPI